MSEDAVSRRDFLRTTGVVAAGLGATALHPGASLGQARANRQDRPNILYIFTDEQFADVMSCAGNADVKTPAMDRLAANGARFSQTYCTSPLCCPSRAGMWTGQMPHENGVITNQREMPERLDTHGLGLMLGKAGYDCQYAGKWHLPGYIIREGHAGFHRLSPDGDPKVTAACVEYLKRPHDRPFFLVASYHNPHDICIYCHIGLRNLKNAKIPDAPPEKWPQLPSNFAVPLHEPGLIREFQLTRNEFPNAGWDTAKWRHYRYAYNRMVEAVDREIGKVLDALAAQGLEEDTVVIFSSDHGDGVGAHGWNQKWLFYEEQSRVPFIISHKGRTAARSVRQELVSNGPDLFATVCDYAGVRQPDDLRGRSVRPLAEGRDLADWPDQVVAETLLTPPDGHGRMLRTRRYKYSVFARGHNREMLVDLQKDPGEMINIAGHPEHVEILDEHRRRLAAWCRQTRDPFADACVAEGALIPGTQAYLNARRRAASQ